MNKIFAGNCRQLLMSRFWDIVVCLNFLWKSTEQALSHLSHCSRKVRMLNTCARAKITWYAKGRKQNNCWPFFSACPHMFLFKSLLAAKILVMISKLSKLWTAKGLNNSRETEFSHLKIDIMKCLSTPIHLKAYLNARNLVKQEVLWKLIILYLFWGTLCSFLGISRNQRTLLK